MTTPNTKPEVLECVFDYEGNFDCPLREIASDASGQLYLDADGTRTPLNDAQALRLFSTAVLYEREFTLSNGPFSDWVNQVADKVEALPADTWAQIVQCAKHDGQTPAAYLRGVVERDARAICEWKEMLGEVAR